MTVLSQTVRYLVELPIRELTASHYVILKSASTKSVGEVGTGIGPAL